METKTESLKRNVTSMQWKRAWKWAFQLGAPLMGQEGGMSALRWMSVFIATIASSNVLLGSATTSAILAMLRFNRKCAAPTRRNPQSRETQARPPLRTPLSQPKLRSELAKSMNSCCGSAHLGEGGKWCSEGFLNPRRREIIRRKASEGSGKGRDECRHQGRPRNRELLRKIGRCSRSVAKLGATKTRFDPTALRTRDW